MRMPCRAYSPRQTGHLLCRFFTQTRKSPFEGSGYLHKKPCSSDITELPALPEKSSVSYDQQTDTYRMLLSDRGQTRPSIQSIKQETDGSATVVVEMRSMEDNAVLDTFSFRLVANTRTAAGQFSLRIVSAERK